jgi:hypothetical protein
MAITHAKRQQVLDMYGHKCAYCGEKRIVLTVDHIKPISDGGTSCWSNLLPACVDCNESKKDLTVEGFRAAIETRSINKYRHISKHWRRTLGKFLILPTVFYFERHPLQVVVKRNSTAHYEPIEVKSIDETFDLDNAKIPSTLYPPMRPSWGSHDFGLD